MAGKMCLEISNIIIWLNGLETKKAPILWTLLYMIILLLKSKIITLRP